MEQLSSCYFCGAALDAQIEPYQVIPPQLEPTSDQQRAVSLCPACRQKLANVVETVVEATDAATEAAIDEVSPVDPTDDLLADDATAATTEHADPEATSTASADGHTPADPAAADDTSIADVQNMSGRRDAVEPNERTGQDTDGPLSSTQTSEAAALDDEPADDTASMANGATTGDTATDGTEANGTATDRTATDRPDTAAATADETGADETGADDTATDDGPTLTALEYNKVIRLLQNREFPVERAEIHEIATSAYQISDREFDAIIDAAIERDLIGEENGQLVSGDE